MPDQKATCRKYEVSILCVCVCVCFTLTKPVGKNPAVDFSSWIVRREGHETKGCPSRHSSQRPTSQVAPQETEHLCLAGVPRFSPTAMARATRDRVTLPTHMLSDCPLCSGYVVGGHCPVELRSSFNTKEIKFSEKGLCVYVCVCVPACVQCRERGWTTGMCSFRYLHV